MSRQTLGFNSYMCDTHVRIIAQSWNEAKRDWILCLSQRECLVQGFYLSEQISRSSKSASTAKCLQSFSDYFKREKWFLSWPDFVLISYTNKHRYQTCLDLWRKEKYAARKHERAIEHNALWDCFRLRLTSISDCSRS